LTAASRERCSANGKSFSLPGEGGIGKTTLVDLFSSKIDRSKGARIARGQCVEGFGGKEAYYPVLEALGQLTRDSEGSSAVQILAKQAPTWLFQMPSLINAERKETLQREIQGATRDRMVREICEALEAMTAEKPLVLIFEDLHWVDSSTLDVISALARRREPAKLVLLTTYRPIDLVLAQSPLKLLKQDLQVHRLCQEIALEHLQPEDISEYLEVEFGMNSLPYGLAQLIYEHSGGNALFMAAIVHDMVKEGLIGRAEGRWRLTKALKDIEPRVPETLQQMLELQFDQLSPAEQRVLNSASVAGEHFSVWAVTTTVDMGPEQIEALCEELSEKQQFLNALGIQKLENGEFSAHYEFRHSFIARLYITGSPMRRGPNYIARLGNGSRLAISPGRGKLHRKLHSISSKGTYMNKRLCF
jgi:predicted ATPase